MRIGIVGAGAVGCFVSGKLLAAKAADVTFVGRPRLRDEVAAHGLVIEGTAIPARIETDLAAIADCDAILVCVKSLATEEVARSLAGTTAVVASLQNGIRNAELLRAHLPNVLAGIVGFNVRALGRGSFLRTTRGALMLERTGPLADALARAGFRVQCPRDIVRHQWTKLLVNLNNAISALSDAPTRELVLSAGYRRIIAATVREALGVLRVARLRPAPLRGLPTGWLPFVLRLPTPLVRLAARAQLSADPQARSSMWEDLAANRPTEIEFLNGEIVRLADAHGVAAPLNRRLVELVHAAEGNGSPQLDADALWARMTTASSIADGGRGAG